MTLICDEESTNSPEDFLLYKTKNLRKKNLINKYKELFYSERKLNRNYRYLDYSFEIPSVVF
jgi:hypothetical protein